MNDLLSVVIPIYNMEKYLKKCVNSVINQTYKNLEILLIDDGSTDKSSEICDDFLKVDKRIKVFHKTNGGLSDAKNFGIKKSKGKYVTFVDADDWIEKNMYETMLLKMKERDADISICGRFIDYENGKSVKWYNRNEFEMTKEQSLIYLNSFYNFDMSSCDKLFEKNLYDNIEFPVGKKCEDAYVTYKIFSNAKKILYVPQCFYHYFQRKGSISRNSSINMEYVYAAEEQIKFFKEKYPDYIYVAITNYVFSLNACFHLSISRKIVLPPEYKKRVKDLKKYRRIILNNNYISKKKKIVYILYVYFNIVYKILLKIKKLRRS